MFPADITNNAAIGSHNNYLIYAHEHGCEHVYGVFNTESSSKVSVSHTLIPLVCCLAVFWVKCAILGLFLALHMASISWKMVLWNHERLYHCHDSVCRE